MCSANPAGFVSSQTWSIESATSPSTSCSTSTCSSSAVSRLTRSIGSSSRISMPCDPTSSTLSGRSATWMRLRSERPLTSATRVRGSASSRSTASRLVGQRPRLLGRVDLGGEGSVEVERDEQPLDARQFAERADERLREDRGYFLGARSTVHSSSPSGSSPVAPARASRSACEEGLRPVRDVILAHPPAQRTHPLAAFRMRHLDRAQDRVLHPVDVVRVDEQRRAQLVGGAGELAQDEHAVLVPARRDVLLRDQVHAVAQGRDEHDVAREVERRHLLLAGTPWCR